MDVTVYRTTAPPNKVKKKLTQIYKFENVRFKEDNTLNILRPTILLQYTNDVEDISKFNYLKIHKFNRYYYIDNINTVGGLIEIECRCDVLMSHANDILASKQYILRQETKYKNPYLFDNLLPIASEHNYEAKPFGDPVFKKDCGYVLLATTGIGGDVIPRP